MYRTRAWLTSLALCGLIVQDAAAQRWRFRCVPRVCGPERPAYGYCGPCPAWPFPAYGPGPGWAKYQALPPSAPHFQRPVAAPDRQAVPQRPLPASPATPPAAAKGDSSLGRPTPPGVRPAPPPAKEAKTEPSPAPPRPADIQTTLEAQGQFAVLLKSAKVAGVYDLLNNPGPFTIFAPTDEAFRALKPGVLARLAAVPESLKEVLLYHALAEKLSAADAQKRGGGKSVLGPDMRFRAEGGRVLVNDAQIIRPDVQCTNGVVHAIDKVLFPPGFKLPDVAPGTKKAAEKPSPKAP